MTYDDALVEATAIALAKSVHPARFNGGVDYWNGWMTDVDREAFRLEARAAIAAVLEWQGKHETVVERHTRIVKRWLREPFP